MKQDLCTRCGKCCLVKRPVEGLGLWVALGRHCEEYEVMKSGKGRCKIYGDQLHSIRREDGLVTKCLSAEEAGVAGLLPESCGYAKRIKRYRSLVINYE